MIAWKRDLQVIFTSERLKRSVVFGNRPFVNVNISIDGSKHLSVLKDEFTVRISNLTYREIIDLISGQYYDIEIIAGYHSLGGGKSVFKGGVLYISQEMGDAKTTTAIILCTNKLIAKYGQTRLNFTLNSGINMYAALKYVCDKAKIPNSNISEALKDKVVNNALAANASVGSILQNLADMSDIVISSDEQNGATLSMWNPAKLDRNKIVLSEKDIMISGGYPRISSDGVRLTILPTVQISPGDVIKIDNSLIDLSISSRQDIYKNASYYLDSNGEYMVYDLQYSLQNRGPAFHISIVARSRDIVKTAIGEGGLTNVI